MLAVMSDFSRRNTREGGESSSDTSVSSADYTQPQGNAAAQDMVKVDGVLGRMFNRIAGVSEGNTDAAKLAFTRDDLKSYLKDQLAFAEGQFFRSAKIGGVADKIMETLDADKDGAVTWVEFQVMVDEMRQHLVGEVGSNASTAEINEKAQALYDEISGGTGSVSFDTIESQTLSKLPEDQDHKGLVAELAALMVLDIVDVDERDKAVSERSISQPEWMGAVNDFTKGA